MSGNKKVDLRHKEAARLVNKWETDLRIDSWTSSYPSVQRLLAHLARRTKSEGSRVCYCYVLNRFRIFVSMKKDKGFINPDEIICLDKQEIEGLVQDFCDLKIESRRSAITQMNIIKTFFKHNGFKGGKELDLEGYTISGSDRKRPEYIPSLAEALRMADVSGSLMNRAIILALLSTGLRVATLCAILYGEVGEELDKGVGNLQIKVHRGMKNTVPNACKGGREYITFTSPEATEAIRLYLRNREYKHGKINETEPLFVPEPGRLIRIKRTIRALSSREIQLVVKEAARKAAIEKWKDVTPHCLRKTFATWVLCGSLSDGSRLDSKTQEILMGHRLPGSQDVYYDRTKTDELRKEHSRLVFAPHVEGRVEFFEILKLLSNTFDVDFKGLLESKKKEMQRDLTTNEQLQLIKAKIENVITTLPPSTESLKEKETTVTKNPKKREKLDSLKLGQTNLFENCSTNKLRPPINSKQEPKTQSGQPKIGDGDKGKHPIDLFSFL